MLLGIMSMNIYAAFEVDHSDNLRVWAELPEVVVADGESVFYIKVYQHDDDDLDYCGFNMEINLPEGVKLNQVKSGRSTVNDITLSERKHETHTIACNIPEGEGPANLRIIAYSSENANFYKDDEDGNLIDHLFTVGLIAPSTLAPGEYQIEQTGIKFSHKDATARVPATPSKYYTLLVDNPTAVERIRLEELDPDDCYDMLGRKVDPSKVHKTIVVSKGHKYIIR